MHLIWRQICHATRSGLITRLLSFGRSRFWIGRIDKESRRGLYASLPLVQSEGQTRITLAQLIRSNAGLSRDPWWLCRAAHDEQGRCDDIRRIAADAFDQVEQELAGLFTHLAVADADRGQRRIHQINQRHVVVTDH